MTRKAAVARTSGRPTWYFAGPVQAAKQARDAGPERRYQPPTETETVLRLDVLGALSAIEERYAPDALYLAGDKALLTPAHLRVAIVGSRDASTEGLRRSAKLARTLASQGVVIVSGLAKGIDRAAHEGALEVGGRTIAVLGNTLARCYPPEHARLQEEIYRRHLLVSQFSDDRRTYRSDFVKRNRTMALLSHASVIVEAGDSSGTLSQAAETQRLQRPLFIMRSVFGREGLAWPRRFLDAGATVLESTEQILEVLGPPPQPSV